MILSKLTIKIVIDITRLVFNDAAKMTQFLYEYTD
jgi:hypothetical protein